MIVTISGISVLLFLNQNANAPREKMCLTMDNICYIPAATLWHSTFQGMGRFPKGRLPPTAFTLSYKAIIPNSLFPADLIS
jgi:hypothetical protein